MASRTHRLDLRVDTIRLSWEEFEPEPGTFMLTAIATVSYRMGLSFDRRLDTLRSGGITTTPGTFEHITELEENELLDLRSHLTVFGLTIPPDQWVELRRRALHEITDRSKRGRGRPVLKPFEEGGDQ